MQLQTTRLTIRSFEPRDAESWIAMVNDPAVYRYLPPGPTATMETFESALARRQQMERDRGYAMWAVELKETGAFIGQCGLQPVERTGPEIELAYHFNPSLWGGGYATEAAIAVIARGLGSIDLRRIIAIVMPANVGSCRVAEKAGMRFDRIATYYGIAGLKKYVAEREWWSAALHHS